MTLDPAKLRQWLDQFEPGSEPPGAPPSDSAAAFASLVVLSSIAISLKRIADNFTPLPHEQNPYPFSHPSMPR
jgi:hypothetical protein